MTHGLVGGCTGGEDNMAWEEPPAWVLSRVLECLDQPTELLDRDACAAMRLLSKAWRDSVDANLRKLVPNMRIDDEGLSHLLVLFPMLDSLDLKQCSRVTDSGLAELTCRASRLTSLGLFQCTRVTDFALRELSALPLTLLDLSWCASVLGPKSLPEVSARHPASSQRHPASSKRHPASSQRHPASS